MAKHTKKTKKYLQKIRRRLKKKLRSNPWKTKADVARHNRRASLDLGARKLWLRVANQTLERTGNDRKAIVAANIAVKNHFLKKKKFYS